VVRDLRAAALFAALFRPVDAASLKLVRAAFGAAMVWEVQRYFSKGWIESIYLKPVFHFTYYGFDWVRPWPLAWMNLHFMVLGLAAFGLMLGFFHRACAAIVFVTFGWVFLLEVTAYQNHHYLILLLALLFALAPVGRGTDWVPAVWLWLLRAQIAIPYFFGGLAKLNRDWLRGEPMRIWLPMRGDFPLLGRFFAEEWMAYAFSYGGLLLDLAVVPLLLWRKSRPYAFAAAVAFHLLNARLFRIGIFPWLMIAATTIFFAPGWPRRFLKRPAKGPPDFAAAPALRRRLVLGFAAAWLAVQLTFPLRHFVIPGDVAWTEEGHRFSWRMRIKEKRARVRYFVTSRDGTTWMVDPHSILPRERARIMGWEPHAILQFAHYLARLARDAGRGDVTVRVEAWVSLNGRPETLMIDPSVDLAEERVTLGHAPWITPAPP
jgi:hypothetical protein